MSDDIPYTVFDREDVEKCPPLEESIECKRCGDEHDITTIGIISFYACEGREILVGIDGKDIRGLNPYAQNILSEPISILKLNNRTWKALCYYDSSVRAYLPELDSVGDLLHFDEEDLLSRKGFGMACLADLSDKLAVFGLRIGEFC